MKLSSICIYKAIQLSNSSSIDTIGAMEMGTPMPKAKHGPHERLQKGL